MHSSGTRYEDAVREFKKQYLREVLVAHRGNQCKAAEELGMHRNTLSRTMAELGLSLAKCAPASSVRRAANVLSIARFAKSLAGADSALKDMQTNPQAYEARVQSAKSRQVKQAAETPGEEAEEHRSGAKAPANLIDFMPGLRSRSAARKNFPATVAALLLTMATGVGHAQPTQAKPEQTAACLYSNYLSKSERRSSSGRQTDRTAAQLRPAEGCQALSCLEQALR